jgi:propionyl-CoA carboxylase alpha chain
MFYDPMIAKLITHAPNRLAAIDAHARALDSYLIEGIQDNIAFLGAVMDEQRFRSGDFTTAYIKEQFPQGFAGTEPSDLEVETIVAAAAYAYVFSSARARRISGQTVARPGTGVRRDWIVILNGDRLGVDIDLEPGGAQVRIGDKVRALTTGWTPGKPVLQGLLDGRPIAVKVRPRPEGFQVRLRGVQKDVIVASPRRAELRAMIPEKQAADTSRLILSPMPGLVVSIDVEQGQPVKAGDGVAVVEAMKMQNIIRAERDGKVVKINVAPKDSVAADEVLIELD